MPAVYLFTKVCEFQVFTEFLKVDLVPAVMRLELGTDWFLNEIVTILALQVRMLKAFMFPV